MTLHDLYTNSKILSNLFFTDVAIKGDYKVAGFEQFGYIETLTKQRKDKVDVYFRNGHQLPNFPRQHVVIQERDDRFNWDC